MDGMSGFSHGAAGVAFIIAGIHMYQSDVRGGCNIGVMLIWAGFNVFFI